VFFSNRNYVVGIQAYTKPLQDNPGSTRGQTMSTEPEPVTVLLEQLRAGHQSAFDALMPVVYDQLRRQAARYLSSERADHTLPATALVHEAYLRLVNSEIGWQNRAHFYAVAARVMRRILVDHARGKKREKRGGGVEHIVFEEAVMVGSHPPDGILELDQALERLALRDERKSRIVEMVFFGGLTLEEVSAVLGTSPATTHRELKMATAWLYVALANGPSGQAQP
jgi:RNA polymerase sigma factor (TIGR02999 family)